MTTNPITAALIGLVLGATISAITVLALNNTERVATNPEPMTCEQKIDKLTREYTAVQAECQPIATSTQG